MKKYGYPKEEKLKHQKEISLLFENGKWFSYGNIRLITLSPSLEISDKKISKIGFSVSKKNYKKAVDRNRIKRLLREAYRLNKTKLSNTLGEHSVSMLFWTSKKMPRQYSEVETEFLKLCKVMAKKKI